MRQAFAFAVKRTASITKAAIATVLAMGILAGAAPAAEANSKYAAIVIDARTGKTLYARNADAARYPASLTKMMTLYMLFEAMTAGRVNKSTPVPFSKNAAAEPPTKLGVKAGGAIPVETAIYALITRSANDVATAVGEMLAGSEQAFAQRMTARARSLGMGSTTFRNAHGLPNTAQKTTARDLAVLSIALREHFPQYYSYFSTRGFNYGKQRINTHNRMFGRIEGVDGIKTGYTRASGFNLATSVQAGGRNVVAVVMGGKSGRSRDDQMAALLREYLPKASTRGGGALVARAPIDRNEIAPTAPAAIASALALPRRNAPTPDSRPTETVASAFAAPERMTTAAIVPAARPSMPMQEEIGEGDIDTVETSSTTAPIHGWVIQIASAGSESDALDLLSRTAAEHARILAGRTPFTEPFVKDGVRYHRARYAGFNSKNAAWDACGALKKQRVACYAVLQQ